MECVTIAPPAPVRIVVGEATEHRSNTLLTSNRELCTYELSHALSMFEPSK